MIAYQTIRRSLAHAALNHMLRTLTSASLSVLLSCLGNTYRRG
jgi:hypothetical protein